jgi:hypothetical protein
LRAKQGSTLFGVQRFIHPIVSTTKHKQHYTMTTKQDAKMVTIKPDTYQHRLSVGLGLAGGSRGSLSRTVGKLAQWQEQSATTHGVDDTAISSGSSSSSGTSARDNLVNELQLMQLEMIKLILMHQRQELEFQAASTETGNAGDLESNRAAVRDLLGQTKQAASTQSCLAEYESLAVLAAQRHPVGSRILQDQLRQVQDNYAATEGALAKATADVAVRSTQFHSLMQSLFDMKQSLNEAVVDSTLQSLTDPMEVEQKEDGEQDEEELYNDM